VERVFRDVPAVYTIWKRKVVFRRAHVETDS